MKTTYALSSILFVGMLTASCALGQSPRSAATTTVRGEELAPLEIVCRRLEAKGKPRALFPGAVPFTGPKGDGRSGANGFLISVYERRKTQGSRLSGFFKRRGSARGVQIVHPFKSGHLVVTVWKEFANITNDGIWHGYGGRDSSALQKTKKFADVFPLEEGREYRLTSQLKSDGRYRLLINGIGVASARISDALPLDM